MFSLFKRTPRQPWVYLGWTEIFYKYTEDDSKVDCTIQFYARGDGFKDRKYEYVEKGSFDKWQRHPYIQQAVIPWIGGNNLWSPIKHPSSAFQEWTKETCGFEFKGERWFKPAEKIEANVLKFPVAQKATD